MKPVILFRENYALKEELEIAKNYFKVSNSRIGLINQLVIGRYSVLPFYHELERDLELQNSKLINSLLEHQYIANFDYYFDVKNYTPKTYFALNEVKGEGPFILKGRTNSRKEQWKDKMFTTKEDLVNKYLDLSNDPLLQDQGIIIREYVPLKSFGKSLSGIDFSNEWRFFFYKDKLLSYGYYWSGSDHIPNNLDQKAIDKAQEIAKIISKKTNFFVLDLAETINGEWILIEANDGQLSGLSEVNADDLYKNLIKAI